MLEKLLVEIQNGGTLETNALAARLDTSPQMVKVMLTHLEMMGKLKDMAQCEDGGCSKCGLSGSCSTEKGKGAKVWQVVVEKTTQMDHSIPIPIRSILV